MTRLPIVLAAALAALSVAGPSAAVSETKFTVAPNAGGAENGNLARPSAVRLRRPSGTYSGPDADPMLVVSGRSIQLAAFDFDCGTATGRTSLNGIAIRKRRGRYRFYIRAHGNVTYSDDHPDENAVIRFGGRFTPRAARALGSFRVRTPRCGGTGPVEWRAPRRAN